jgi:preprotein translocase subunit SecE
MAIALAVLVYLWRKGHLMRLGHYFRETREELRKCTWPNVTELRGSTTVVLVAVALLGLFVIVVDLIFTMVIGWIT